jgi:ADP-ribose diphosphatase
MAKPSDLFRVERMQLEFSNGVQRTYERLLTGALGAVIVVPVDEQGRVLLVREYAGGLHRYELGLPKGRLEPGETAEQGANRELKEEIGYGARERTVINALTLAPGYMDHVTQVVLAQDLYEESLPGDEPEPLEVVPWPLESIAELMSREDVTEGRSIAALFLAREYLMGAAT